VLVVLLTVGAGAGLHYLHHHPGGIQVGNAALSYRPNWRFGYLEFRQHRSGLVFAHVVHLGPLILAFWPPQPAGPKASTRTRTGR
jgi:hypothetical protein